MKKVRKPAALLTAVILLTAAMLPSAAGAADAAAVAEAAVNHAKSVGTVTENAAAVNSAAPVAADGAKTELSAAAEDGCEDFGLLWDYDNFAAVGNLDEAGFADDKTAWQMTTFDRSAYAVYKAADDKMLTEFSVEITGCNEIIFPVIQYSYDGTEYTNLTEQMTVREYDDAEKRWTKTHGNQLWSSGTTAYWHKRYSIGLSLPCRTKYVRLWIPSGGEYTKPIKYLDCMYIRKISVGVSDYPTVGEDLSDSCADFNSVNSYSNMTAGYSGEYNSVFGDESVWRIADRTQPSEFIYKAAEGMTLRSIELEISRQNNIFFPKVEWSADGVSYTALTEPQTEKKTDIADYGSGAELKDSSYNTWHKRYTMKKYAPENTRYIRVSLPAYAVDQESCLYFRNIKLTARQEVLYDTSLKEVFGDCFDISTSLEPQHLLQFPELLKSQFNVLVTENQLKPWIHSGKDTWQWSGADRIVNFAAENGMKVRAHTLVAPVFFDAYSNNESAWWYKDDEGNSLFNADGTAVEGARELTLSRLENHVKTIVSRYKGKVYAYDVVNEAYKPQDSDGYMRDYTRFWKLLGRRDDSWINLCFKWAHEADPDAVLIYNDNDFTSDKLHQDLVYNKIKEIRDEGIPACVGMQMHYTVDVSLEDVDKMLSRFSGLCDIYVTELDMFIRHPSAADNTTGTNSNNDTYAVRTDSGAYPEFMRDEVQALQARKYASLFDLFRKYSDSIKCVGFWGVYNGQTEWMKNCTPILFGENAEPNLAYRSVIDKSGKMPRWRADDMLPKLRRIEYYTNDDDNTVTVYTGSDSDGSATASIYVPSADGTVEYLGGKYKLAGTKTFAASGRCGITLQLGSAATEDADESVRLISLAESGKQTVWDYFYTNVGGSGKITENFNDFEKMYAKNQVSFSSNMTVYDGDYFGLAPAAPIQTDKDRYVVYKMPSGREAAGITLDFWTYRDFWGKKPKISGSADGESFDTEIETQSTLVKWGSRAMNRYRLTADTVAAGTKYIKIDLNDFSEAWVVYLEKMVIETRGLSAGREYVLKVDSSGTASAAAYGGTADKNAALVIAKYDADGLLKLARVFTVDIGTDGAAAKKQLAAEDGGGYFTAYLFENIQTLKPLAASVSSNIKY